MTLVTTKSSIKANIDVDSWLVPDVMEGMGKLLQTEDAPDIDTFLCELLWLNTQLEVDPTFEDFCTC